MSDEPSTNDRVRARAYELWEQAGMPTGRSDEFWEQARSDIEAELLRDQGDTIDEARSSP